MFSCPSCSENIWSMSFFRPQKSIKGNSCHIFLQKVHHFPTKISQEYTPISSAGAWEDGRLELLVKTYPDGCVSRFFGTLRTVPEAQEAQLQSYAPLEEQILGGTPGLGGMNFFDGKWGKWNLIEIRFLMLVLSLSGFGYILYEFVWHICWFWWMWWYMNNGFELGNGDVLMVVALDPQSN